MAPSPAPRAASVPGHYLLHLLQTDVLPVAFAARVRELLQGFGFRVEDLARPGMQVPVAWLDQLLGAAPETPSPAQAALAGEQVRLTSQGELSVLLMTSATLGDALRHARFVPLLSNGITMCFLEGEDTGTLFISPQTGSERLDRLLVFYAIAGVIQIARLLAGSQLPASMLLAMDAPDEPPAPLGPAQWGFNDTAHRIVFPLESLDAPCLHRDDIAQGVALRSCELQLAAMAEQNTAPARVRRYLASTTPPWSQASAAAALHTSVSTLKRNLATHATTFNDLLQDHRQQLAVRLLLGSRASLAQIADTLGYSDQANFSHAFRRWTGRTPAEFRAAGRSGAITHQDGTQTGAASRHSEPG